MKVCCRNLLPCYGIGQFGERARQLMLDASFAVINPERLSSMPGCVDDDPFIVLTVAFIINKLQSPKTTTL
jgi:hypothetical protein